jgi:hypothetical protein
MSKRFNVADHVTWNSEPGRVSGTIIKVHTRDFDYKGYTHHAKPEEPGLGSLRGQPAGFRHGRIRDVLRRQRTRQRGVIDCGLWREREIVRMSASRSMQ